MKPLAIVALSLLCLRAEDKWVRIRSGPFEVLSNGGERAARERMYEAEQYRYALGQLLGKKDLAAVWPIRMLVLRDKKQAADMAQPDGMTRSREAWVSANFDDSWRKGCARVLIADNTNRLPPQVERGLISLVSTLEIKSTKLGLGAPPPDRTRDWARMRLLAAAPEYVGRMRVFISNLEQTPDLDVAYRNAFEKRAAEIEKQVDASLAAGVFETAPMSGRALSDRDFTVREATAHDGAIAIADLLAANPARAGEAEAAYKAAGGVEGDEGLKKFDAATKAGSLSARAWVGLGTRAGFLKAAELNPRWAEPDLRIAALETDPGRKATYLQKAANLEPRNAATWQALALALVDARQFVLAAKAWSGAERASESPEQAARIRQARQDLESKRADFEESEHKRRLDEAARDLARVKNSALAEIREAEAKANHRMQSEHGPAPEAAVKWEDLDKPNKLDGKLERVDCLANGQARLNIRIDGGNKLVQFLIAAPDSVAINGSGAKSLGCGPQKPSRALSIEYGSKRDVQSIEFK